MIEYVDLKSRINSMHFLSLKINTIKPTIHDLKFFITWSYDPILERLEDVDNSFLKDVRQLSNFVEIYFSKYWDLKIPDDETPLPELMIPFYHKIIDYLIKSN